MVSCSSSPPRDGFSPLVPARGAQLINLPAQVTQHAVQHGRLQRVLRLPPDVLLPGRLQPGGQTLHRLERVVYRAVGLARTGGEFFTFAVSSSHSYLHITGIRL